MAGLANVVFLGAVGGGRVPPGDSEILMGPSFVKVSGCLLAFQNEAPQVRIPKNKHILESRLRESSRLGPLHRSSRTWDLIRNTWDTKIIKCTCIYQTEIHSRYMIL